MDWTLDKSRPICKQLCEKICVAIAKGDFSAGEKLFSVREAALLAGVNPNTVQKAFEELERRGVLCSVPSSGWFVSNNTSAAIAEVNALRRITGESYLAVMSELGCDMKQALEYLNHILQDKKEDTV